jgi:hypothetical protein
MTSYAKITRQIGDRSIGALERTGDALIGLNELFADVRGKLDLPHAQVPEPLAKLQGTLPKLSDIIESNVDLTTRLIAAHNAVTLKVLTVSGPAKHTPAPARKSAK